MQDHHGGTVCRIPPEIHARIVYADGTDPKENLMREDALRCACAETGDAILYLWQNVDTVVLGRNQDAAAECDLDYAAANGIQIVRRRSGGGAVYHDLGCLNVSLILPRARFDPQVAARLVPDALRRLGVETEPGGRNDLCLRGKKISGSAYYESGGAGVFHATILLHADVERMQRVLTPCAEKLARHGVRSVRARVGSIASDYPHIRVQDIMHALGNSFCKQYGGQSE